MTNQPGMAQIDVSRQSLAQYIGSEQKRVITGSDILGRLLRGISRREDQYPPEKTSRVKEANGMGDQVK